MDLSKFQNITDYPKSGALSHALFDLVSLKMEELGFELDDAGCGDFYYVHRDTGEVVLLHPAEVAFCSETGVS